MAKKKASSGAISNRRARFDYDLEDTFTVGMMLTGAETKALRLGRGQLQGAYVNVLNDELWLVGAHISPPIGILLPEDEQARSRKLLAKRSEIDKLVAARKDGRTIVPLEVITRGRYIKLKIAIGKGKKRYDKRETIKRREQERDIKRQAA